MANTLFERDLVNFCAANAVQYLKMKAVDVDSKSGYELWVKVKRLNEELLLITHNHREPRIWASVDRAVSHFRERYKYTGQVQLFI
jgi:hypothetical protein